MSLWCLLAFVGCFKCFDDYCLGKLFMGWLVSLVCFCGDFVVCVGILYFALCI